MKNTKTILAIIIICFITCGLRCIYLQWAWCAALFGVLLGTGITLLILVHFGAKVQKRHDESLVRFINRVQKNLE